MNPGEINELWETLEHGPGNVRVDHPTPTLAVTSHAGLVLLVMLAAVYLSGLVFEPMRAVHFAIGFALIPVVALKLALTAWRAVSYYAGRDPYRSAGPPWLLPRLLAPLLGVAVIVAIVTGVVLWWLGTERGPWATLHTDSVVVLAGLLGVHVVIHLRRAWRASLPALAAAAVSRGERAVLVALVVAVITGAAAIVLEPPWHPSPPGHERGDDGG